MGSGYNPAALSAEKHSLEREAAALSAQLKDAKNPPHPSTPNTSAANCAACKRADVARRAVLAAAGNISYANKKVC